MRWEKGVRWDHGEPVGECLYLTSDSEDTDDSVGYVESDYDPVGLRKCFQSPPPPHIHGDDDDDCNTIIYPAAATPASDQHSTTYHLLRDFSQTAIIKYNHDTGNRFEFVELVEASVRTMLDYALILVIFKAASQTDDDTTMATTTTSFRAEARSASKSLSADSKYHIQSVVPLHTHSDHISSAPGKTSESADS